METSSSTIASLLLRKLLTSIFLHSDEHHKLLHLLRHFLASSFLFLLTLFSSKSTPPPDNQSSSSGVSRALSQLLLLMNDIPVSSRKYELIRSLAETIIDDNLAEAKPPLAEVNCAVLSAAFARSLGRLEAAMAEGGEVAAAAGERGGYGGRRWMVVRGVRRCVRAGWRLASKGRGGGYSAEKVAAEVLWLAEKMAASGCVEEAVWRWASAGKVAWLALSTEPRLQGSLVKVSAFLIRQAKELSKGEDEKQIRATKIKMLMSWLPLLCSANNGTDAPVLSMAERAEVERILEEVIWTLAEEEQEMVLSLWLHHFTYCPASDWPNLRSCYTRWCNASRATLLKHHTLHTSY
ncbi:hypothetical protein SASPL_132179 [Salvia splendens]|uniref:Uncharacterized protein n=1 Tax=Salvia splendens TaxID=180675 RepID=A0A8X8XBF2_SALSN|nr:uncharacterized protein LOC121755833 [Salvia splendens]XP_042007177.1 uncharacterized protein LOC121755833 [Salvia splendens]KAG6409145.1 hypothetical protein SASPL_132179 [Salvia splendens]